MKMVPGDLLVAITEGGETSSVLGTVKEFTASGGRAFLLFNNPAELIASRLERCREAISNPAVTVLDLSCGPMAIAGSTRMQATTCEQLVASAALETAAARLYGDGNTVDFKSGFAALLDLMETDETVSALAEMVDFEADIYRHGGRVTYFADDYMLDIFTDTTERSPTFMLPGFRRTDDSAAPEPWAFVRNPLFNAAGAIRRALGGREIRCLDWTSGDYAAMNAPEKIISSPPSISAEDLIRIPVGNEFLPSRYATSYDAAILFCYGQYGEKFSEAVKKEAENFKFFRIMDAGRGQLPPTRIKLFEHLSVKLQWNNISTGTMVKIGRVSGNWMSHVAISNKKLIDRAIRLVAELGNVDYHTACVELFRSTAEPGSEPAVRRTLARLRKRPE
jgi:N-acetylmuramic acid 6-phosphate etherase